MSTENQVALFATETQLVAFDDKKGNTRQLTAEGALFKGGAALTALKDIVQQQAVTKAQNGRYRPAIEIILSAYPSLAKAMAKLYGDDWITRSSKAQMHAVLNGVEFAQPGKNGYTKKQENVRLFVMTINRAIGYTKMPDVVEA